MREGDGAGAQRDHGADVRAEMAERPGNNVLRLSCDSFGVFRAPVDQSSKT